MPQAICLIFVLDDPRRNSFDKFFSNLDCLCSNFREIRSPLSARFALALCYKLLLYEVGDDLRLFKPIRRIGVCSGRPSRRVCVEDDPMHSRNQKRLI